MNRGGLREGKGKVLWPIWVKDSRERSTEFRSQSRVSRMCSSGGLGTDSGANWIVITLRTQRHGENLRRLPNEFCCCAEHRGFRSYRRRIDSSCFHALVARGGSFLSAAGASAGSDRFPGAVLAGDRLG